jgi:hypothetical protein
MAHGTQAYGSGRPAGRYFGRSLWHEAFWKRGAGLRKAVEGAELEAEGQTD